ncbi:MAG: adenylyl-sulfate kinase [Pseudomonadales bacterium]|nr:adenylyl-sulfate kinase [Pseudomonadales bacterium]
MNITWHEQTLSKAARAKSKSQKSYVLWFTGLSASGKSTLANALEHRLHASGHHTYLLDGDNVRHGLNQDLGFSDEDRVENIRRIAEVSKLFVNAGTIILCAFISPFKRDRDMARAILPQGEFIEVYVNTPLTVCEQRDPKGLYRKARQGEIRQFTGIDSVYEAPDNPEITINTENKNVENCVDELLVYLQQNNLIHRNERLGNIPSCRSMLT